MPERVIKEVLSAMARIMIVLIAGGMALLAADGPLPDKVQFNRDIRPILSDKCFHCHGPDKKNREAHLRLDTPEGAQADLDGHAAIVPGKPEKSELIARITTDDEEDVMPPLKSKKSLTAREKELLRRWIADGAVYEGHWALIPPQRPTPPKVNGSWPRNPIDQFILARQQEKGLQPAAEAAPEALIRRVALDLTGLPPTPAEIDAYLADRSNDAYEKMVDRYLASEHYGEHMARYWLDIGRYADTDGYQYDKERTQWPWRDWVIRAYNSNMPFDQFTIEQLAGDQLAEPTTDQVIATGFNRNHPITIEGGVIDEEYRVEYVMDRVVTTTQAWLAMSVGCARCHDHKYDPVSQKEFYQIFSFFNSVADKGNSGFAPQLSVHSPEVIEQIAALGTQLDAARAAAEPTDAELVVWEDGLRDLPTAWTAQPPSAGPNILVAQAAAAFTALKIEPAPDSISVQIVPSSVATTAGRFVRISVPGKARYLGLAEVQVFAGADNIAAGKPATQSTTGYGGSANRAVDGKTDGVYSNNSITHTTEQDNPWWEVDLGSTQVINKLAIWNRTDCCTERLAGFTIEVLDEARKTVWQQVNQAAPAVDVSFSTGGPVSLEVARHGDVWLPAARTVVPPDHRLEVRMGGESVAPYTIRMSNADAWQEIAALTAAAAKILEVGGARTDAQKGVLKAQLRDRSPSRQETRAAIAAMEQEKSKLASQPAVTMLVMKDLPVPRKTFLLERGQYDQPRHEELQPDVPIALGAMAKDLPHNRLGFAKWVVDPAHPLTARVAVNRYWQRLFGVGIVKTVEEFGAQGEFPSHPALLDWLAAEFIGSGWDVKAMQRLMVTSATYRQSSQYRGRSAEIDPENRLLARGARFRLDAEVIRDSALAVSGLLEQQLGGPSVYPYQPAGLWMEINNRPGYSREYPLPAAGQLYRRSMYTFWKRTLPHPQMQTFDAPNRESCTIARSKTDTPLQALALLHDPQYVEAARLLARRIMTEGGTADQERLAFGFRLVAGRLPNTAELQQLGLLLAEEKARFAADEKAAAAALAVGMSPPATTLNATEHAAWLTIARLLLNLDEFINKG